MQAVIRLLPFLYLVLQASSSANAGTVNSIPVVSQVKSAIVAISGNAEEARRIQDEFSRGMPGISQIRSLAEVSAGDANAALETQKYFAKNMEGMGCSIIMDHSDLKNEIQELRREIGTKLQNINDLNNAADAAMSNYNSVAYQNIELALLYAQKNGVQLPAQNLDSVTIYDDKFIESLKKQNAIASTTTSALVGISVSVFTMTAHLGAMTSLAASATSSLAAYCVVAIVIGAVERDEYRSQI